MAVVFAGKAVFDLQVGGILRVTALRWLGGGLPLLGLYPNLQVVLVQGLFIVGALLALPALLFNKGSAEPPARQVVAANAAPELAGKAGA
jgi:hypothetical protein